MNKPKRPLPHPDDALPLYPVSDQPVDVWEQINKYGTYEVQDTTDTENAFPAIGPDGGWRSCAEAADAAINDKKAEP